MKKGYFLGIGSNINPEQNLAKAIKKLLELSPELNIGRAIITEPENMQSQSLFLNSVAEIETELDAQQLKQALNQIETCLGRDRTDPNCKVKDRQIDLDILCPSENINSYLANSDNYCEYVTPLLDELVNHQQSLSQGKRISLDQVIIGEQPSQIKKAANSRLQVNLI